MSSRWTKPPIGWMKCNYDGSYLNNQQTKSWWIIRVVTGCYKGAAQATGGHLLSALECEFQALIMALQHVWSKGYRKFVFEGDYKQVMGLMNRQILHFGNFSWIR